MFKINIPNSEIKLDFARSSGAGGQNVNKTSTKVIARWSVPRSKILNSEQKSRIFLKLKNKINNLGEVIVTSQTERSQWQNRALAIKQLQKLVNNALRAPKIRRPTKPTKASKLRRLEYKKLHSQAKKRRRTVE